ncbi:MAG TPA: hypothetical protein VJB87_03300 [Candidatus Nanoarchaeia archaeon]|nr:hypothetical protein [Candidatus Nanoarchaeia archaeon]
MSGTSLCTEQPRILIDTNFVRSCYTPLFSRGESHFFYDSATKTLTFNLPTPYVHAIQNTAGEDFAGIVDLDFSLGAGSYEQYQFSVQQLAFGHPTARILRFFDFNVASVVRGTQGLQLDLRLQSKFFR